MAIGVVWSVFWRCALLGVALGAFLGDLYVNLTFALLVLPMVVLGGVSIGQLPQLLNPGVVPLAISGLPTGAAVGAILGIVGGLVLGIVARLQLGSSPIVPRHRSVVYSASALVTVLVGGWRFSRAELPEASGEALAVYLYVYGVPLLLSGLAQGWIASRVVVRRFGLGGQSTSEEIEPARAWAQALRRELAFLREVTVLPILILLVGIVGGGALVLWPKGQPGPAIPTASPLREVVGPGVEFEVLEHLSSIAWLRDPDELAILVDSPGPEGPQIQLVALDGSGRRTASVANDSRCLGGNRYDLTTLADGRLAYLRSCEDPVGTKLVATDVRTGATQAVFPYPLPEALAEVSLADDLNSAVVWRSEGQEVRPFRLLPDRAEPLAIPLGCPCPASLSPNGESIALFARGDPEALPCVGETDWTLFLVDAGSLEPRPLTESFVATRPDVGGMPVWSPNGRWIAVQVVHFVKQAFTTETVRRELWVVDAESGRIYLAVPDTHMVNDLAWSPDSRRIAFLGTDNEEPRRTGGLSKTRLYVVDLTRLVEGARD